MFFTAFDEEATIYEYRVQEDNKGGECEVSREDRE
jgi:hypothetical protein